MDEERRPPSDELAEQALLGCVLLDPERAMFLLNELKFVPEMFYSRAHQIIFLTMQGMATKRRHIDLITLIERLRAKGHAEEIGGSAYLNRLLDAPGSALAAPVYAEQLMEKYKLRNLISIAKMTELAVYDDQKADDISAEMVASLIKQQDADIDHDVKTIQDESMSIAETVHEGGPRPGWPSFLEPLNSIIGSYVPKHVYIVAGTPSNGKTTLVCNELVHKAVNLGVPAAFFSMEMSEREIRQNMAATLAGIDAFRFFLLGRYTDQEADSMKEAYAMLLKAPLYIIDRRMNIEQINSRIMFLVKKHGVRLFGLDYLQLIRYSRDAMRQSRNDQVAEWSAALHENAERFDFVLLLVSQLSRMGIKSRELTPPPPSLESLRDSGVIEQDADGVIFIYKKPGEPYENFITEWPVVIDCCKHRGGPIGAIKAVFIRNRQKFESLESFEYRKKKESTEPSLL
jgi:replicative DNA helicase